MICFLFDDLPTARYAQGRSAVMDSSLESFR